MVLQIRLLEQARAGAPCGRGKLAQFSFLQRFAVWWVAPPWPILSVAAVLLALCRLVEELAGPTPIYQASPPSVQHALRQGEILTNLIQIHLDLQTIGLPEP